MLYTDYLLGKDMVGGVRFALCDRSGEWVMVDFQNDHHDDFRAIEPEVAKGLRSAGAEAAKGILQVNCASSVARQAAALGGY